MSKKTFNPQEWLVEPQRATAQSEPTQLRQTFLDSLPQNFDRKTYVEVAQTLSIPPKTAEKYIANLCAAGKLTHAKHGEYCKPK